MIDLTGLMRLSEGRAQWVEVSGGGRSAPQGGFIGRKRERQVLEAVEADLRERGLPLPPVPMSREKVFVMGF